ncbi:MAG TPA: hypothetical protein VHP11_16860 [Tepidisphaeraceae bacterium]|nr:hypothetical protein [Tepidisphaeraceae bacterium]
MMPMMPAAPQAPGAPNVVRPGDGAQNGQLVEFDVWAHDETVEPGKTYRYRVRLTVRNPLYKMTDAVTDAALAQPIELPTDANKGWSEWTKPIEVRPRVQMFLAGGAPGKDSVRFDIYRWQNGKVNKTAQSVAVSPGDMVGGVEKASGIDFNTGWTVVDIRQVGNSDWRVTLVDDNGMQKVRQLKADTSDGNRKELEKDAQAAEAAAKAAALMGGTNGGAATTPEPAK